MQKAFPPARAACQLPLAQGLEHFRQGFLAVAEQGHVDKVRQRLRIEHARPADEDQGIRVAAVFLAHRHASQIEHIQDIRIGQLVLQREPDGIEF